MSVYTVITKSELQSFLTDYDLGELTQFEGISAGIENTNYFVDTTKGRFVLTIFEHHTFEELGYFLNIMSFMAKHKIPTAQPEKTREGTFLKSLKDKPAALVERLTGGGVDVPSLKQTKVMGEQMARFHLAGDEFRDHRDNDRALDWMDATFNALKAKLSEEEIELIEAELAVQHKLDWNSLPQGVIHADLFCDNALFDGDILSGIIDLYYACNSILLYDLAVMVNDWCRVEDKNDELNFDYDEQKIASMVSAYQTTRPLTSVEKQVWPLILRLAALRFWLSRLKDKHQPREGEMTQIKNPDVFKVVLKKHKKFAKEL